MFQWMLVGGTSRDYTASWGVTFDNKVLCCLTTKNHDSAQYVAVVTDSITKFTIHASQLGTTYVLGIGY